MESTKPISQYTPHEDYTAQSTQGFHKPFPPRPIQLGVPLQPLRPIHDRSLRQDPWMPYMATSRTNPADDKAIRQESPEKTGFLAPPNIKPPPVRTSLQCRHDLCESHFSPYHQPDVGFWGEVRTLFTKYFVEWWMVELLSWTFSAFCMAAIIGVLSYFDGKEIPQWPLGLTLNGFISVFSGLAKASLLLPTAEALGQLKWNWFAQGTRNLLDFEVLDAASRGPFGSLLLLGRMKGFSLSCIGAVIVLAAIPLDLFFQSIVQYPMVWIPTPTEATVSRAVSYLPRIQESYIGGNLVIAKDNYLYSSLMPSFFSNGSVPELDLYCPTKNCTWEPFETLGVCGTCSESIAQQLTFGCYESQADWLSTSEPRNTTTFKDINACGYWLNASSDARILMTGYEVNPITNDPGEGLGMRILPLIDANNRSAYYQSGSLMFKDVADPIVDFFIAGTPRASDAYQNVTPMAHECVMQWCVQRLETSFFWGQLSQNISQTWENKQDPIQPRSSWEILFFDDGTTDYRFLRNITIDAPSTGKVVGSTNADPRTTTYELSNDTMLQTSFAMDDFAPLVVASSKVSAKPDLKYEWVEKNGQRAVPLEGNPWLDRGLEGLTEHVQLMAEIMTTSIRSKGGNKADIEIVAGTAWDTRTHVQIRWPYMILPLILLVCTLIFLVATVIKSTKEEGQVRIYKTSSLATLVNGVGDDVQRSFGPNCRMGQARARARELSVKLVPE